MAAARRRAFLTGSDVGQTIVVFALRVGTGILSVGLFAVTARVIGPTEFGIFSVVFSAAMLLGMVGSFGQQIFLVKEIPRARVDGNRGVELGAYRFAIMTASVGGLVAAVAVVVVSHAMVGGGVSLVALAGAILCFMFAVSQMTLGALRVDGRTLLGLATRDFLWRAFSAGGIISAGVLGGRAAGVGAGEALLIVAVSLVPIVGLHVFLIARGWNSRWDGVERIWRGRAWTEVSAGLALVAVISSADLYAYTIALGQALSPTEAGAFFAALKAVELISLFLMAVTLVVAPEISALTAKRDAAALQRKCNTAIILQGVPTILAACVLFLAASPVLSLFEPSFAPYANSLRVLMVGMLVNALTGATVLMLQLAGLHWRQVLYQGGSLLLAIAALPLLVAYLGVVGAAWSFVLSKVMWSVLAIIAIRRRLGVDPSLLGLVSPLGGGMPAALSDLRRQVRDAVQGARA